jgi:CDP-glucose 4,6-dehydratase
VLEPLSGYLLLGAELGRRPPLHAEAFNFGPRAEAVHSVAEVVEHLGASLPDLRADLPPPGEEPEGFHEAGLLKLVCDKALHHLKWRPVLDFPETMKATANWYRAFYRGEADALADVSREQLRDYLVRAVERRLPWAID